MKVFSLIILTVFISLSVFGAFGMMGDTAHEDTTCLASRAQNGVCPPPDHTLASAFFHTNALKVFSTTLISLALALFSFSLLFAGLAKNLLQKVRHISLTFCCKLNQALSDYFALQKIRFVLARLEHSPTSR